MDRRFVTTVLILAAGSALVGCATSRSEVRLATPAATVTTGAGVPAAPAIKGFAVIRTVADERRFEQAPDDPSTPSLGFEGAQQATAETKLRAIGRKRNTFGQALGDVLLQGGQTVEIVVRDTLADALRKSGYQVVDAAAAPPSALLVDVHVRDFWAWLNPGFWAITVNARIATDLEMAGQPGAHRVEIHHKEPRQFVTEGVWVEAVQTALQAWRDEAMKKLQTLVSTR